MAVGTVIGIVLSIASAATSAGMKASEARKLREATDREEKETAKQAAQVEKQQQRRRNLGTLGRQAEKRIAATGASREAPGRKPITRGTLGPQMAPSPAQDIKPGVAAAPGVFSGATAGVGAGLAAGLATTPAEPKVSRGEEVSQALQGAATLAEGVISGAGEAAAQREAPPGLSRRAWTHGKGPARGKAIGRLRTSDGRSRSVPQRRRCLVVATGRHGDGGRSTIPAQGAAPTRPESSSPAGREARPAR